VDASRPFSIDFDIADGFCKSGKAEPIRRHVSNMAEQFVDVAAAKKLVAEGDPLLYEFYSLDLPEKEGALLFGTTILYPGVVGEEYYMTKGHFHTVLDTAEVYYCLKGHGMMVMETPEGETDVKELKPGDVLYVAGRWAHRSVNVGDEPLIMFFCFPAHAGHDYGTIESKGFRKLVVRRDGKPSIVDNPHWS
jgi:glucose-6-phosphate isomerase